MTDKQIIIDGVDVLKEKINMCFILLLNKLETPETIEQPPKVYKGRKAWVEDCIKRISAGEKTRSIAESYGMNRHELTWRLNCEGVRIKDYKKLKLYN